MQTSTAVLRLNISNKFGFCASISRPNAKVVEVNEGEMIVVPMGVEHRPVAVEEFWMMLFEPANIKHTGDVKSHLTVDTYQKI